MAQYQSAVARDVIDVFVAVDVPFARALAAGHIQGKWLGVTSVVGNTAREDRGSFQVPLGRAGVLGDVVLKYRCHRASLMGAVGPSHRIESIVSPADRLRHASG